MPDKTYRKNDDPQRTGGEKELKDDLERNDKDSGEGEIKDRPGSENRRERQRANFIDLHGDEDNDPQTSERKQRHGDSNSSTGSTTSTSSTPQTTSTT